MWNIEGLDVYRKICDLIKKVYGLIGMLPSEEKFALGDQMRRAVTSVKLNIIEGSGKRTSKEFISYLNNAMGSLREVRGCVEVGVDLGYFVKSGRKETNEIKRIERLLAGYIKYVEKKNVK
ncbi:four helix bundle protein [Candidatus Pacearchaeota archaeon]|nr:four helix bundle protein [Candidatus Pacearchaeota archaeon]